MARARIGKLFHLTPLVDDLGRRRVLLQRRVLAAVHDAQLLRALAPARGDLRHRRDVDRADALLRSGAGSRGDELVPLRREVRPARPQHGVLRRRPRRPRRSGWRPRECGSPTPAPATRVFCHPKDTPGMLEFHPGDGLWSGSGPSLPARVARLPRRLLGAAPPARRAAHVAHHRRRRRPRRRRRSSTSTCSTRCRSPTRRRPSPEARRATCWWARTPFSSCSHRATPTRVHARDLARVGPSVTGVTFTVRDMPQAATFLELVVGPDRRGHRPRDPVRRRPRRGAASTGSPTGSSRATRARDRGGDGRRSASTQSRVAVGGRTRDVVVA